MVTRVFTSTNAQTKGATLSLQNLRLMLRLNPRTASELLSPPALYSSLCPAITLLSPLGIKGVGSQVLGSPLCELCFSFRQIQSCVAQGGLELTETPLPFS